MQWFPSLVDKKDLGVHTELLSDGIVELMKKGVVTNQKKTHNPGKTIASFCMGSRETYDFLDENPAVEFKRIDYTNNPLINRQKQAHDRHQQRHGSGSDRPGYG